MFFPFYHCANVVFHLFPSKSLNHVVNQPKQQALAFTVGRHGLGLVQVFPNILLQM